MPRLRSLAAFAVSLAGLAAPQAFAQDTQPLVPDCSTAGAATDNPGYAQLICANADWVQKVGEIKSQGDTLAARLPEGWRRAFTAHQQAFPRFTNTCPTEPAARTDCVETTLTQRLTDIADLAAHYDADMPACTSGELTVADSGLGDAGMSKQTRAYTLTYTGNASCRLSAIPR